MNKQDLRGQILLNAGVINESQLEKALTLQKESGRKIGTILIESGFVSEEEVLLTLERQSGIPWVKLHLSDINSKAISLMKAELICQYQVCPIKDEDGILTIAISDPLSYEDLDDIRLAVQREIAPVLVAEGVLFHFVEYFYKVKQEEFFEENQVEDVLQEEQASAEEKPSENEVSQEVLLAESSEEDRDLEESRPKDDEGLEGEVGTKENEEELTGYILQEILQDGLRLEATELSIEKLMESVLVRFRVDGLLLPAKFYDSYDILLKEIETYTRWPLSSGGVTGSETVILDCDEPRGQLKISLIPNGDHFDVHIKCFFIDRSSKEFAKIGISQTLTKDLCADLNKQRGLVWVIGGSDMGVSTTLRSMMKYMNTATRRIISFEKYVEYPLQNIYQFAVENDDEEQINNKVKEVLGISPDVIVIDSVTHPSIGRLLVEASLRGKLILLGMNVKDYFGGMIKLEELGVSKALFLDELTFFVRQQSVRLICSQCREVDDSCMGSSLAEFMGGGVFYKGTGCEECSNTGYKGRRGLFEGLKVNDRIRRVLQGGFQQRSLRKLYVKEGSSFLEEEAIRMVREKLTTIEDVQRVGLVEK